jgi:hypothetical protein
MQTVSTTPTDGADKCGSCRIDLFPNSVGNMNLLIPSAKKTNPARSRTTNMAAGALVFSRLKSVFP